MDTAEILRLYDLHERRLAQPPGYRIEEGAGIIRQLALGGGQRTIIYSDLDEARADAAIERELELIEGAGDDCEWKLFSHDKPADLKERLAARGFEIGEEEAVMALDLDGVGVLPEPRAELDIRRIRDPEALGDMVRVHAEVWNEDFSAFAAEIGAQLREEPDYVSVYIAYVGGRPVSSCRVNFPKGSLFASLWGGSTLAAYRGRGIYTELLNIRIREATQRGYRFLTIDASPMSRPIVEKRGFRLLCLSYPCEYEAGRLRTPPASRA